MRRPALAALLLTLLLLPTLTAAQPLAVTSVRIHQVERGGPAVLAADPIERAMVAGTFAAPAPDDTSWTTLDAEDDGWIRDDRLVSAYAHAAVDIPVDGVYLLEAMGYTGVYVNGEPHVGNIYGYTDQWEPWQPAFDFARVPVSLHAGTNDFLFYGSRFGLLRARLEPAEQPLVFNTDDVTRPDLVVGEAVDTWLALPVINTTDELITDATITVTLEGAEAVDVELPPLSPLGVRKVAVPVRGPAFHDTGRRQLAIELRRGATALDRASIALDVKLPHENRRVTFRSAIDGSVQYFGYLPASDRHGQADALVLSLHGAGVEAINQSGSYAPLPWGHIVAPTNRRAYGFNWEDWGRRDAIEALSHAFLGLGTAFDVSKTYLTGHSMGGHGSWHLAGLMPDRFAAVGPSAGWISFWSYRPARVADEASPLLGMLERATLPSRTLDLATNLAGLGVYVLHGADDQVVSVDEARTMREHLAGFHRDVDWHEEPGAGHWWDRDDAPGADCVAWAPMFDFFARHRRADRGERRRVEFVTPSPAVSSVSGWAVIADQHRPFIMSKIDATLDPIAGRLAGATENIAVLGIVTKHVEADTLQVRLDGADFVVDVAPNRKVIWLRHDGAWQPAADLDGSMATRTRGRGFREAFANRPVLVYGTRGTADETAVALAHARHDAEHLWYQGNSNLAVLPDTAFAPDQDPTGNVILYGNADTNALWSMLWTSPDLTVQRGALRVGDRTFRGADLGLLAIRPRDERSRAVVGVMASTGVVGQRLLQRRPYLRPAVAYPDVTVLRDRGDGTVVLGAGFLGRDWSVNSGEFQWAD